MGLLHSRYNPKQDIPNLDGKVLCFVGTAGVGKASILHLAKHQPAHVYFSGRNSKNAETVIDEVRSVAPHTKVSFISCDLTSLSSVKQAAEEFVSVSSRLDILMCNAGTMAVPPALTKDGYELQFGTNHVGHALLIKLLLPTLLRTADLPDADVRIINLTSTAYIWHPSGGISFESLRTPQDSLLFGPSKRYGQSKLANILYAAELARRYPQITTVSVHPGYIQTDIIARATAFTRVMVYVTVAWKMVSLAEGAYNQVWAATTEKSNIKNGAYYEPVGVGTRLYRNGNDKELAERLWDWTENELKAYVEKSESKS